MLESMTGYGSAESVENGVRTLVELRSVNNRFAEISVKLPRQLLSFELEVRELVRAHFHSLLSVLITSDSTMKLLITQSSLTG